VRDVPRMSCWCQSQLVRRRRRREEPHAAFAPSRTQSGLRSALAQRSTSPAFLFLVSSRTRSPQAKERGTLRCVWIIRNASRIIFSARTNDPPARHSCYWTKAPLPIFPTLSFRPHQTTASDGLRSGRPSCYCSPEHSRRRNRREPIVAVCAQ